MIIGISGKIGSGKDLVGQIMQVLSCSASDFINTDSMYDMKSVLNWLNSSKDAPWEEMMFPDHKVTKNLLSKHETVEIKKFAGKLKEIAAILIGCDVSDFEDREFKEKELGEEWDRLTPRKLLQLLGTEAGREIIHPNIWVNALFADYKVTNNCSQHSDGLWYTSEHGEAESKVIPVYPNWIITDVRFPNEAQAIKDRGGVVIRINKPQLIERDFEHLSETSLDNYEFDHVIENNGSIEELVEKVKQLKLV